MKAKIFGMIMFLVAIVILSLSVLFNWGCRLPLNWVIVVLGLAWTVVAIKMVTVGE